MSKHYSSSGDRRRDSSSRSRRDDHSRSRRRSSSPGPSRSRRDEAERDEKVLPKTFGRREETDREVDDLNVLQRMKSSYDNSPLKMLYVYQTKNQKVKIWTRNYKEVRGVMTGYIVAFDKHWNIILRDVDEVYLKHKKNKTPFLRDVSASENLPDMPAKVPRQKKTEEEKEAAKAAAAAAAAEAAAAKEAEGEVKIKTEKKTKRKKKKNKNTSEKRHLNGFFIRGDNVVMVTLCNEAEQQGGEEEEAEEETEEGEHVSGSA